MSDLDTRVKFIALQDVAKRLDLADARASTAAAASSAVLRGQLEHGDCPEWVLTILRERMESERDDYEAVAAEAKGLLR